MPTSTRTNINLGGIDVQFLVEAQDSDGAATVFECAVAGGAMVPPPHSHDAFDETVYGLEGVLTFTIDGRDTPDRTRRLGLHPTRPGPPVRQHRQRRREVPLGRDPRRLRARLLHRDPRRADRSRGWPTRRRRAPRSDAPPRPHAGPRRRLTPARLEGTRHEHSDHRTRRLLRPCSKGHRRRRHRAARAADPVRAVGRAGHTRSPDRRHLDVHARQSGPSRR